MPSPERMGSEAGVLLIDACGRPQAATATARRLLDNVNPDELRTALLALRGRAGMASDAHPIVLGVPTRDGGRILITGGWADRQLTAVVQADHDGDAPESAHLTARERDVLRLVAQGLPIKRIAALLEISPWTVTAHVRAIYSKTGVSTRSELLALMLTRARAAA